MNFIVVNGGGKNQTIIYSVSIRSEKKTVAESRKKIMQKATACLSPGERRRQQTGGKESTRRGSQEVGVEGMGGEGGVRGGRGSRAGRGLRRTVMKLGECRENGEC